MLRRDGDDAAPRGRRLFHRPLQRPVQRLGGAAGEREAPVAEPDGLLDMLARDFNRGCGFPAPA